MWGPPESSDALGAEESGDQEARLPSLCFPLPDSLIPLSLGGLRPHSCLLHPDVSPLVVQRTDVAWRREGTAWSTRQVVAEPGLEPGSLTPS